MPDLANGNYVSQSDADRQWVPAARDVLLEVARDYGAWITYDQLSQRIQASTGITTRQPLEGWIGRVIGKVADDAASRGEPRLTSLCVGSDLTIGESYPGVEADASERMREQTAAADRLECYRWFGATMPADGGAPKVLPQLSERPARARATQRPATSRSTSTRAAAPTPQLREATCTECFMVVPLAPTCRDCGAPMVSEGA